MVSHDLSGLVSNGHSTGRWLGICNDQSGVGFTGSPIDNGRAEVVVSGGWLVEVAITVEVASEWWSEVMRIVTKGGMSGGQSSD